MDKKGIAVFGGSFNPPLNSHFSLAEEIINEIDYIGKILFVPVSKKYEKPGLLDDIHRYNMLKLVCDKYPNFEVSDIEHQHEQQLNSYTTLELLKKEYPDNDLYFVIGTDNLKELYWWGYIDQFLTEYKIIVIERGSDNMDEIIESQEFLQKYRNSFIKYNQLIRTNLSSTYVREKLKEGKSVKYLMPEEVANYIKENNLYRG